MNTNSKLHLPEDSNMTTIIDIESQNETNVIEEHLLKGILRNNDANRASDEIIEARIVAICASFVLIVVSIPFIVCDLYFGFSESNCSTKEPHYNVFEKLLPLKIYLLVSGFSGIFSLGSILTAIYLFDSALDKASYVCLYNITFLIMYLTCLFSLVWNVLASITFWGFIFNNKICNTNFTNYVFVSLVIKLLSSFCTIYRAYTSSSD
jgi:hypothetical protein